jgi:hypothetical protein
VIRERASSLSGALALLVVGALAAGARAQTPAPPAEVPTEAAEAADAPPADAPLADAAAAPAAPGAAPAGVTVVPLADAPLADAPLADVPLAQAAAAPPAAAPSAPAAAPSAPAAAPATPPDAPLRQHRTVFDALTERAIGLTSRRVRYDWRRDDVQIAAQVGLPVEFNNFNSLRAGARARFPSGDFLLELGVAYVWVFGTESTERLALTPLRQPGRPDRLELDFGLAYPLAEGVVTAFAGFVPSTELVLNAHVQVRYLLHPGAYTDLSFTETLQAIFDPELSDTEVENLEDDRLAAMEVDRARYTMLAGLGVDLYFQSGLFVTWRTLIATPMLSFLADTELLWGLEFDLAAGWSF